MEREKLLSMFEVERSRELEEEWFVIKALVPYEV